MIHSMTDRLPNVYRYASSGTPRRVIRSLYWITDRSCRSPAAFCSAVGWPNSPVISVLSTSEGSTVLAAAAGEHRQTLAGPFGARADQAVPVPNAASRD